MLPLRVKPNASQRQSLAELNANNPLRLDIKATYTLEQAASAFVDIASGHTHGKVMLIV